MRVGGCDPGLPIMTEKVGGGLGGLVIIWASRAAGNIAKALVPDGSRGLDTGQDPGFQLVLLWGRKLGSLDVQLPVTTKVEKGVQIAHADEVGVL